MWHLYVVLMIASCVSFFIALVEAYAEKTSKVNWIALGLLLFVLVITIQLARQ